MKCTVCPHQAFPKLDAQAVRAHLMGGDTIGTYAIRENDTCVFLAADFDGTGWAEDAIAYKAAARELGVQAELERLRSGEGCHAWIFFSESIQARWARQLGTVIVARAIASRHAIKLETYDRFFPNQDFLPKGGFGNLIALPLQKISRDAGNTVFLNDDLTPIEDQWAALAGFRRLSGAVRKALDAGSDKVVARSFPGQIEMESGARLTVHVEQLPSSILSALKRTATFANPVFFEKERMRFSTWNIPRFIFCGELQHDKLILPRGSLDSCLQIAKKAGSSIVIRDVKPAFKKLKLSFTGELSPEQKRAVAAMAVHDIGVLVAPPGAGKTVMGCALIAKRKLPTLVLVHRVPLMDQWKAQIGSFLGVDPKKIGTLGGQRMKQSGSIDVGMLQTLANVDDCEELLSKYGQVIIDECHHIPAVSFESVLKTCSARYVVGLTATPYRKDGHQVIIHMQCGPVRYEMKEVDGPKLDKAVIVRETKFKMPEDAGPQPAIHLIWENLVADPDRLRLVSRDLRASLEVGRFPLVISERKEHLHRLAAVFEAELSDLKAKSFTLIGGMGKKARAAVLSEIQALQGGPSKPYILATGAFIGEGFDFPALDTLNIAMPVSFKGKLIQYAGRLHRAYAGKTNTIIYDYLDSSSALTVSMFRKRLAAYRKMDYRVETSAGSRADRITSP